MQYLRVRFERHRRGLPQRVIATAANIPQPTLAQIESGRLLPTSEQLERLARTYGVAPSDLLKPVELSEAAHG